MKKLLGAVLVITLFSGIVHAGDSITPGIKSGTSLWLKAKAALTAIFSK